VLGCLVNQGSVNRVLPPISIRWQLWVTRVMATADTGCSLVWTISASSSLAGVVAYLAITAMEAFGVNGCPAAIMSCRTRKYWTYKSGVKVLSSTTGWSLRLANVCGAPGGTITMVPAGASYEVSPTVKVATPETT
jgi:hypothetical protein